MVLALAWDLSIWPHHVQERRHGAILQIGRSGE
jgi:hypothetical protein